MSSGGPAWHRAFALLLLLWTGWVLRVSVGAVPGLLDDGTHMIHSERYRTTGFFTTILGDLHGVAHHARFYEIQYALLGGYNILFGHDIFLWYLATFFLCLATGLLIYGIVRTATGDVAGAVAGSVAFLTASPLAEAARANFGKVEVAMAFLFVLSLALWVFGRARWEGSERWSLGATTTVAASLFALTLAAVAKESGRLLSGALVLAGGLGALPRDTERAARRWQLLLASSGLFATAACLLAFAPSRNNAYIRSYFTLDSSLSHVRESAAFYLEQTGDVLIIALTTLVVAAHATWTGTLRRTAQGVSIPVALFVTGCAYGGLLTMARFRLPYYFFVPGTLFAISFGWTLASCARRLHRSVLLAALVLTRLYSIPYNYYVAGAQQYFDAVNDLAMRRVLEVAPSRVISLDIEERSQLVQEWNLLRWFSFGGRLAPMYGAKPDFVAWSYQQSIRNLDPGTYNPALPPGKIDRQRVARDAPLVCQVGDLIAVRRGALRAFHVALRGVVPQSFDPGGELDGLDREGLERAGEVGGSQAALTPLKLPWVTFDYRWEFFRVVRPLRYVVMGREVDGWMLPQGRVRLIARPGAVFTLTLEVPGWLPFRYPWLLEARAQNQVVAEVEAKVGGIYRLAIPSDSGGVVELKSDQWFQPSAVGVSPDTRLLSYRVIKVQYEDAETIRRRF